MDTGLRIIFYGTPEFAVPSLEILHKNNYNIVAVVTAPDSPSGRGQKVLESAVKQYAVQHNIPVLQPTRLKDESFIFELQSFRPDLQVVVAFRMLPEQVWRMPKKGTFNLHASLLPQYRGAAPINWAIINGEHETGVTTFFLQHEIDTGDIIFQEKTDIGANENVGQLHDKLMQIGAGLVLKTVKSIESGTVQSLKQIINLDEPLKSAPKLNKENTRLNCKNNYSDAYNFIRGLSPYPAAYSELYNPSTGLNLSLKIFDATPHQFEHTNPFGAIETDNKSYFRVYFRKGYLDLKEIQIAGKKRMPIKDFLNGFKFEDKWILQS